MDVIRISWNEFFAVDDSFDLNQLRKLKRVKELKHGHYERTDDPETITVEIGSCIDSPEKAEEIKSQEYKKESEQRYEWYTEKSG